MMNVITRAINCFIGIIFLCLLFFTSFAFASQSEKKTIDFVVVIASYNNEPWCIANLESIVNQTYPHWQVYFVNDCSTDNTGALVEQFVKERGLEARFKIIHNEVREGNQLANFYKAIHDCKPDQVIVTVDGDDRLSDNQVLDKLATIYQDEKIWVTYGNYKTEPEYFPSHCDSFPKKVLKKHTFRNYKWLSSHLRTFYAKIFQMIKKKDLLYKGKKYPEYKGRFYPAACDHAFMFPILEMAALGHIRYIPEILYLYNVANPINENKIKLKLQQAMVKEIRSRAHYKPLKRLF